MYAKWIVILMLLAVVSATASTAQVQATSTHRKKAAQLFEENDADKDGKLSRDEFPKQHKRLFDTHKEYSDVSARVQAGCDWFGPTDFTQMDAHRPGKSAGLEVSSRCVWCQAQRENGRAGRRGWAEIPGCANDLPVQRRFFHKEAQAYFLNKGCTSFLKSSLH